MGSGEFKEEVFSELSSSEWMFECGRDVGSDCETDCGELSADVLICIREAVELNNYTRKENFGF